MQERENVLRIFREAETAIEKGDNVRLKTLSDETIHTASITQDADNLAVAVMIYSLSKILERENYRKLKGWGEFYSLIKKSVGRILVALEKNDEGEISRSMDVFRSAVEKLSGNLKEYIADVFQKARINKASRIYEHGVSMEKTAKLLGITMWELAEYSGQKRTADESPNHPSSAKQRIKIAMEIFG